MNVAGSIIQRLPAAVFMVVGMFVLATLMRAAGITPHQVSLWLSTDIAYLLQLVVVLLPYGAAVAGLVAVVYLVIHHHEGAIAGGISSGAMIVIDLVWQLTPVGAWVVSHLTGAA